MTLEICSKKIAFVVGDSKSFIISRYRKLLVAYKTRF